MAKQDEAPRTYATRLLTQIERTTIPNFVTKLAKLNTGGSIDPGTWTNEFIADFNTESSINTKDKIPTEPSTSHGIKGMNNTDKNKFLEEYQNTRNPIDYPFQGASIVNSIGDGTCLIHSCFNALSNTYRNLDEKYQQLIGLFFRKYVYAESGLVPEDQKKKAKQLFADATNNVKAEDTYLDDVDVDCLTKLLDRNILVFHETDSGNNCRYFKINDGNAIFLYLNGQDHYDTIKFDAPPPPSTVTFEQTNQWVETHLPTTYRFMEAIQPNLFLEQVTQFLSREAKHSMSPSDLFLDAVSIFLAPPKNTKSATSKNEDNMSNLSDDEEDTIEEYIPAIYDRLNHYLGHIYKVMKSIKKSGDKKQFRDMGTDTASKFAPTTIENNTECNGPFAVEVQTIKTDAQGNQIENSTECL